MTLNLNAIKARADAATEGPWEHVRDSNEHLADCPPTYESLVTADNGYVAVLDWGNISTSPDAEFIAAARQDIPALIAEVERLSGVVDRVRESIHAARHALHLTGNLDPREVLNHITTAMETE